MITNSKRIQIIVIIIFVIAAAGVIVFQEKKKLDGRKEIETQIREDFQTRKATLKTWADYLLQQKDLPNEWSIESRLKGGLWFHDESPHDGRINLFEPKFVLPKDLEQQLKAFNISEIYVVNDSANKHLEYIYGNDYITSSLGRTLRLIYNPNINIEQFNKEEQSDEFNWHTILEPDWILESRTYK